MANLKKTVQNSLLILTSVFVTLVIIEIVLTAYLVNYADSKTFIKYASLIQLKNQADKHKAIYSSHRYLGYYPTPNYVYGKNKHNKLGYRGDDVAIPKTDNLFRIVCLGGSTTYTTEIKDYRKSYPYLLQKYLKNNGHPNIEVINAGSGGWSSWETLINFQLRVLDLDPDMVIIYHSVNDINQRMVWPAEAYIGDNSGSRIPGDGIFMPSVFEYSTLLRVIMIRTGMATPHIDLQRSIDKRQKTFLARLFQTQKRKGNYPDGIFKQVSAKEILEINKPVYFERNIRNLISIAKDHSIQVIISSFAHSRHFLDRPFVGSEEYLSAHEEHNRLLKTLAGDTDVSFFDFASIFPDKKEYYIDGQHVTEAGAPVKARLFGEYLISNSLLP